MSRRAFLRRSLASALGLGVMSSSLRSWARITQFIPALVIGSGFGGAVAALRLAEAGIKTVVLERGRRWIIEDPTRNATFATFEQPDGRCAWLSPTTPIAAFERAYGLEPPTFEPFTGLVELIQGSGISILTGAGVGGGSLPYNAILVEPHRQVFEQIFPSDIDFDEMEGIYYPRVRSVIRPSVMPSDILETDYYQSTRVNLGQAQEAGFHTRFVTIGLDWAVVRQEIRGERVPSAIAGQSLYGLNSGAKQSLDRNYLAMAEATGQVEILPLHAVYSIEELPSSRGHHGRYVVSAVEIDAYGEVLQHRHWVCQHLFLAAGSIGTTKLLLRAKATGTLRQLNDQVGQHWAGNGDSLVGRVGLPPNNVGTGGPCGHFIMEDYRPEDVNLQDPNRPPPNGLIELVTPPHLARQVQDVLQLGYASTYADMGIHPPIGSLTYDAMRDAVIVSLPTGFPPPDPPPPPDERLLPFLMSARQMLQTLDDTNQGSTTVYAPNFTAHPLGGAVVGAVCDPFGRVRGHLGLYVVDGAFIPGFAGAVNPSLTIAALAERSVERIIAENILGAYRAPPGRASGR
jgi:cholesterol oxidase